MKYYITDKNMKSTQGVRDIPFFSNINERNQWVSTHLLEGKSIDEVLEINKEVNTQIVNIQETDIEVDYDPSLVNKNYLIAKDNISEDYLFYIITNKEIFDNGNVVTLTLELDGFMTYPLIIDNLQNFELVQGHSDFANYFDYEFDGGRRYIKDITNQKDNIGYTVVVYRKLHSGEEGAVINGITAPYKIFVAPEKTTTIIDNNNIEKVVSKEKLIEYYNQKADGLTYNIQIIPYVLFNEVDTVNHKYKVNDRETNKSSVVHFNEILELKLYTFNEPEDIKNNTYDIDLSTVKGDKHNFNTLPGLEDNKIVIEGDKEIDWPFNIVDNVTNELKIRLGTFLVPNENKTYYTFNDLLYYRTDENTWDNTTELTVFVNQLNEYKANNPVSSSAFLEFGGDIAGSIRNASYAKGIAGKGVALGGGLVSSIGGSVIDRQNKKKAPESVKGDVNTYFNLALTKNPYHLSMVEYEYKGSERDSVFNGLYKYGAGYEGSLFIKNYSLIKRPHFNFMRLDNLSNSQLNMELPQEVLNSIGEQLASGVRIWNNGWLDYNDDLSGNGDKI